LAGSAAAGNNQMAVYGLSDSGVGLRGGSNSSNGVRADSGTASIAAINAVNLATTNTTGLSAGIQMSFRSGTAANGFGGSLTWLLKSSTTSDQSAGRIDVLWATAADATRKARLVLNVFDTAVREGLRVEASGTAPMMGVLGAAAVVRQTSGADLTNNVTVGGTTDQIDDFAGALYATDAATIRNDIYQLARKLKQINDGLRLFGHFT